jgi:fatty acid desaturase
MQAASSPKERLRPDTADTNIEWFALWRMFFSAVRDLTNRGYILLKDHRKLKWALALLVAFISFQSYFLRELVAALFFFTILYAVLAALVTLYVLFDHVLYSGILWVGSLGHSFCLFLHNHIASPSRVLSLPHGPASDGDQRLGRALTSAKTILLPKPSPGASLALESVLQAGRSPCSELHYLGGRKTKGDGK